MSVRSERAVRIKDDGEVFEACRGGFGIRKIAKREDVEDCTAQMDQSDYDRGFVYMTYNN